MGDVAPRRMAINQAGKDERMTTEFKVGDVVECIDRTPALGGEIPPERGEVSGVGDGFLKIGQSIWWRTGRFRRASESQREGGFAVGQRVRIRSVSDISMIPSEMLGWLATVSNAAPDLYDSEDVRIEVRTDEDRSTWYVHPCDLEPAPAQPVATCEHCDGPHYGAECPVTYPEFAPPQPAPMTRAARVLAGLERDPYDRQPLDFMTERERRWIVGNEAARLRMARMSLDRPLDAEQARWERLVCSKVPTGRR